jgi:hypothetical protein
VHEIPVALGIKMFKARRDALMVGLHAFMEHHNITDESQALEMIVAEHSDGPTFASIFQQTVPKLKEALKEDGLSVEEAHARMKTALQDHVLAISDVIKRKGGYKELQKTA